MAESRLPVLVLRDAVLFPRASMPLSVGREESLRAVEAAAASEHKTLLVAVQKDPATTLPTLDDLFPIATLAVVRRLDRAGDLMQVVVQGLDRMRLRELTQSTPHLVARADPVAALVATDPGVGAEALHRVIVELAQKIALLLPMATQSSVARVATEVRDTVQQAYLLAGLLGLDKERSLALLGAESVDDLQRTLHDGLVRELEVLQLRSELLGKVQAGLDEQQRRALLQQEMSAIRRELGDEAGDAGAVDELRARIERAHLPEGPRAEAERELQRLQRTPGASPEHQLVRSWLELVAALPWRRSEARAVDLTRARQVLDADHTGLVDVKSRIVEHLAVMKLNPAARAPILCFVGPPGVGKTSLGQSIARALGRPFERLSLGGVHDEAELRGHRRTYIGAMPGRIVQALRRAGADNPVLMLDEIDKLGAGRQGDPAAALLEVLDPAQNAEFHDNYLDLPFDLSRVFFLTTANTLDTIPGPLLDRMEVIRLAGYTDDEKVAIARDHLLQRQLQQCGLTPAQLTMDDATLRAVVRRYTREAGVRQLERALGALARKAAARIADGKATEVAIDTAQLADLLGPRRFFDEELRARAVPGVAAGLAWTEVGGTVLHVETLALPDAPELVLTGQLGDVMRESARAALSWVRAHAADLGIDAATMPRGVHVHVPAGATPKDGPSAGVTMATALVSLFTRLPVRQDVAMTGEITLSGLVLPVGGIREKLLAAHRAGVRSVVVPAHNERDLAELPALVRDALQIHLAGRIEDALVVALPQLTAKLATPAASG
jgi:ATP-dependent Lon protease